MRRWLVLTASVAALAAGIWLQQGQAYWQSRDQVSIAGGAAYTGPGDIVSFTWWCGFRAYSAATAGTKAIRVVRASDSAQSDINTLANGSLDAATLTSFLAATTGKVVTCYDKVSTSDVTQGTDANRPAVTANALGTSYGMTFAGGQFLASSATFTSSQPFSFVAIARNSSGAASGGVIALDNGAFAGAIMALQSSNALRMYAGSSFDVTETADTWHAFQGIFNNASSISAQDGTETTGTTGAQSISAYTINVGRDQGSENLTGLITEAGYIAATISAGNRTSLNSNMHAGYGGW